MAIRFCCAQCGQPIEVDDEHAGHTAACPYCRHVMSVPTESTYQPEAAATARPLGPVAPPQPGASSPLSAAPPALPPAGAPAAATRQRAAHTYGTYALVCALLALLLFGIGVTRGFLLLGHSGVLVTQPQPTPDEISKLQRQIMQIGTDPWVAGPQYGGLFFALVGLVLAIVSLTQTVRGNWRGLVAGIVCGLFFLCLCTGVVFTLLTGFGQVPSG